MLQVYTLSPGILCGNARFVQNFSWVCAGLRAVHQPRQAADSKREETCWVEIACGMEGPALFALGLLFAGFAAMPALAQKQPESKNMELVGYSDLQGRSAYQPTIHKQGNRWIAYIGHHGGSAMNPLTGKVEDNGTSIVDVTDPKNPKYLAHIPGDPRIPGPGETGGAQMARVCDGSDLPRADKKKVYLLRVARHLFP